MAIEIKEIILKKCLLEVDLNQEIDTVIKLLICLEARALEQRELIPRSVFVYRSVKWDTRRKVHFHLNFPGAAIISVKF